MRKGVIVVQLGRRPERLFRIIPSPVQGVVNRAERRVSLGGLVVQLQRFDHFGVRQSARFRRRHHAVDDHRVVRVGEQRVRPRIRRIQVDGFPESGNGFLERFGRSLIGEVQTAQVGIVRSGVDASRRGESGGLFRRQPDFDLAGDFSGDLGLQRQDVVHVAVVRVAPDRLFRASAIEGRGDADLLCVGTDRSLDDPVDAKLARDLRQAQVGAGLLREAPGGRTGDHLDGADFLQVRDQLFRLAVDEVGLIVPAGQVAKRQHGNPILAGRSRAPVEQPVSQSEDIETNEREQQRVHAEDAPHQTGRT